MADLVPCNPSKRRIPGRKVEPSRFPVALGRGDPFGIGQEAVFHGL